MMVQLQTLWQQIRKGSPALLVAGIIVVSVAVIALNSGQTAPQLSHKAPKVTQTRQTIGQQPLPTDAIAPAVTISSSDQTMQANPSVPIGATSSDVVQPSAPVSYGGGTGNPQATDPDTSLSSPPVTPTPPNKVYKPVPIQPPFKGGCAPVGPPGTMHPDYCIVTAD